MTLDFARDLCDALKEQGLDYLLITAQPDSSGDVRCDIFDSLNSGETFGAIAEVIFNLNKAFNVDLEKNYKANRKKKK